MNKKEIKIRLEKVNRCFAHIEATQDLSQLDKDVLLGAIREFYETCILEFSDEHTAEISQPVSPERSVDDESDQVSELTSTKDSLSADSSNSRSKPVMVFANKSKSGKKKQKEKKNPDEAKIVDLSDTTHQVEVKPKSITEANEAGTSNKVNHEKSSNISSTLSNEFDDLFAFKEATDLSQKLSEQPISDLTKCLSLNDRFLFKKELFNNEEGRLESVLTELNACADFDQARQWMESNILSTYDWKKNKQRINKAKEFIKLTRRRFL